MKLSEILGWPNKKRYISVEDDEIEKDFRINNEAWNTALTSCDREIDREALVKLLYDEFCNAMSWENVDINTRVMFLEHADKIISTMPQWLKRIDNGKI